MPRPRKSSVVLEAKGAFKKDPQRKREDVRGVGEIGEPPETFTDQERELWRKIAKMVPAGVVTGSDGLIMEALARYWAKFRETKSEDITAAQVGQLIAGCNALCMSPQSRTKIQAPKDEKKNPFEGF